MWINDGIPARLDEFATHKPTLLSALALPRTVLTNHIEECLEVAQTCTLDPTPGSLTTFK